MSNKFWYFIFKNCSLSNWQYYIINITEAFNIDNNIIENKIDIRYNMKRHYQRRLLKKKVIICFIWLKNDKSLPMNSKHFGGCNSIEHFKVSSSFSST